MTAVNKVEKKDQLSLLDIVRDQLVTYCYFKKITLSDAAIYCLAELCIAGKVDLNSFCVRLAQSDKFASAQVVRNIITRGEEEDIVIKTGNHRKQIEVDSALNIQNSGNILLDFKFLYREPA